MFWPFILNERLGFKEFYLVEYPKNSRESESHVVFIYLQGGKISRKDIYSLKEK